MTSKGCLRYGCLLPLVLIAILILGITIADKVIPSRARRALPSSGADVQEYYSDSGFTGDFVRVLKARLPEADFQQYASNLGLTKYDPAIHGAEYDTIKIGAGDVPKWWNDPREMDNCYFKYTPGEEYYTRITWKDGWVYFISQAW